MTETEDRTLAAYLELPVKVYRQRVAVEAVREEDRRERRAIVRAAHGSIAMLEHDADRAFGRALRLAVR